MKRLAIFLFLALAAFASSFAAARAYDLKSRKVMEYPVAQPFASAVFALTNRPFAIVIVGINNGASVEKTIASVFSQNYENYRVVYIDDASDDGSFDLARDLIYGTDRLTQATLVHNEERLGVLANICRAVQTCRDEEIVIVLQGEDWLAHEWVLQRLNAYYANPDLWLACGQTMDFPTYQPSLSHLKTFYAGLFKKIRASDFVYAGNFLPACAELAYMTPMLEMGQDHCHFIPEVFGINNRGAAVCKEDRELQIRCEQFIRSLDPYPTLTALQVASCGD